MTRLRAIIVDDEPLAREGIALRLERYADLDVVGSLGRPADALKTIRREHPDLLFLDVQMPGLSGFDLLRKLGPDAVPAVIFVTAHDQHALAAFRAHALDYLLKPIDDDAFHATIERVRRHFATLRDGEMGRRVRALLGQADALGPATGGGGRGGPAARIAVPDRGRIGFVTVDEIERIEADGDQVRIFTAARSHRLRERLRDLEVRLDPARFARVHRSTIVNLNRVVEMQPWFHGEFVLVMAGGAKVKLSRTYRTAVAKLLGGKASR